MKRVSSHPTTTILTTTTKILLLFLLLLCCCSTISSFKRDEEDTNDTTSTTMMEQYKERSSSSSSSRRGRQGRQQKQHQQRQRRLKKNGKESITAMTYNLYLGVDWTHDDTLATSARSNITCTQQQQQHPHQPPCVPKAVDTLLQQILHSKPTKRISNIAQIIQREQPDVIGLQNVYSLRKQFPGKGSTITDATTTTEPVLDFLEIILTALSSSSSPLGKKQVRYKIAHVMDSYDVILPALQGFENTNVDKSTSTGTSSSPIFYDLRITNRNVILIKSQIRIRNARGDVFDASSPSPIIPSLPLVHGWVGIDAKFGVRNKWYTVVTVALDTPHKQQHQEAAAVTTTTTNDTANTTTTTGKSIQYTQAHELLATIDDKTTTNNLAVILLGDFHTTSTASNDIEDENNGSYNPIIDAGYEDAWAFKNDDGFTCCRHASLAQGSSDGDVGDDYYGGYEQFTVRRDIIFGSEGDFKVVRVNVVGVGKKNAVYPKLWNSDHAGVVATLHPTKDFKTKKATSRMPKSSRRRRKKS